MIHDPDRTALMYPDQFAFLAGAGMRKGTLTLRQRQRVEHIRKRLAHLAAVAATLPARRAKKRSRKVQKGAGEAT